MAEAVFIVGAGPSGISSAYYLQQAGISYRVVDRAHVYASTWSNLYPSLRLNTAGFVTHLPGQRIPLRYGIYPLGRDFYRYISDYMRQHSFNIDLGVEVTRVAPDGDQWLVETSQGGASQVTHYPCVIIASGRFGNPYLPPIPGVESFSGRYLHSHDFTDPAGVRGSARAGRRQRTERRRHRGRAQRRDAASRPAGDPQRHRDRAPVSLRLAEHRLAFDLLSAAQALAQGISSTASTTRLTTTSPTSICRSRPTATTASARRLRRAGAT